MSHRLRKLEDFIGAPLFTRRRDWIGADPRRRLAAGEDRPASRRHGRASSAVQGHGQAIEPQGWRR
ncbi:hypothetical protein ACU4GH_24180 [Bradyrhizobium betae]